MRGDYKTTIVYGRRCDRLCVKMPRQYNYRRVGCLHFSLSTPLVYFSFLIYLIPAIACRFKLNKLFTCSLSLWEGAMMEVDMHSPSFREMRTTKRRRSSPHGSPSPLERPSVSCTESASLSGSSTLSQYRCVANRNAPCL